MRVTHRRQRTSGSRGANPERCGIRDILHAARLDIRKQTLQPIPVEASLLVDMAQQMLSARRDDRSKLLADRTQLGDELVEARDPPTDESPDRGKVAEMQKEECAVERVRYGTLFLELPMQQFPKFALPLRADPVDRAHATARDALL